MMQLAGFYSTGFTSRSYSGLFPHYIYKKWWCFPTAPYTHTDRLTAPYVLHLQQICLAQSSLKLKKSLLESVFRGSKHQIQQECRNWFGLASKLCTNFRTGQWTHKDQRPGAWNWMLLDNTDQPSSGAQSCYEATADLGPAAAEPDRCCSRAPSDMLH